MDEVIFMDEVMEYPEQERRNLSVICGKESHIDVIPIEIGAEMGSWDYCPVCKVVSYPRVEYLKEPDHNKYRINL